MVPSGRDGPRWAAMSWAWSYQARTRTRRPTSSLFGIMTRRLGMEWRISRHAPLPSRGHTVTYGSQARRVERLLQHGIRSHVTDLAQSCRVGHPRVDDHADGEALHADLPQDGLARPIGQLQVQDDTIRWGVELVEPFGDRGGFEDLPTAEGEDSSQEFSGRLVVIDQQHNPTPLVLHRGLPRSNSSRPVRLNQAHWASNLSSRLGPVCPPDDIRKFLSCEATRMSPETKLGPK